MHKVHFADVLVRGGSVVSSALAALVPSTHFAAFGGFVQALPSAVYATEIQVRVQRVARVGALPADVDFQEILTCWWSFVGWAANHFVYDTSGRLACEL